MDDRHSGNAFDSRKGCVRMVDLLEMHFEIRKGCVPMTFDTHVLTYAKNVRMVKKRVLTSKKAV